MATFTKLQVAAIREFKMTDRLFELMARGLKTTGSYNPDETMFIFVESLTAREAVVIEAFLAWVHETKRTFGSGNYKIVFKQFVGTLS